MPAAPLPARARRPLTTGRRLSDSDLAAPASAFRVPGALQQLHAPLNNSTSASRQPAQRWVEAGAAGPLGPGVTKRAAGKVSAARADPVADLASPSPPPPSEQLWWNRQELEWLRQAQECATATVPCARTEGQAHRESWWPPPSFPRAVGPPAPGTSSPEGFHGEGREGRSSSAQDSSGQRWGSALSSQPALRAGAVAFLARQASDIGPAGHEPVAAWCGEPWRTTAAAGGAPGGWVGSPWLLEGGSAAATGGGGGSQSWRPLRPTPLRPSLGSAALLAETPVLAAVAVIAAEVPAAPQRQTDWWSSSSAALCANVGLAARAEGAEEGACGDCWPGPGRAGAVEGVGGAASWAAAGAVRGRPHLLPPPSDSMPGGGLFWQGCSGSGSGGGIAVAQLLNPHSELPGLENWQGLPAREPEVRWAGGHAWVPEKEDL